MKLKLLTSFVCLLAAIGLAKAAGTATNGVQAITISWGNDPSFDSNGVVRVYHSTDITVPLTNWAVLTNVQGSFTNVVIGVLPSAHFFTGTYSNFWGESDFSPVASTPPFPRFDVNLLITKGSGQ